jgi:chromate transporter
VGRGRDGGDLREVIAYFLRLGFIAFGGPAAHIALMRRELVQQRGWVTDQEFIDTLGVTNLIPGPNSTEMTMHLGNRRAGWWGLWLGGLCFIGPAVLVVLAFAWSYVRWGSTPAGEGILFGVQPVVLAIIIQAIWGLRSAAIKGWSAVVISVLAVVLALTGVKEVWLVLGGGFAGMALHLVLPGRPGSGKPRLPFRIDSRRVGRAARRPRNVFRTHLFAAAATVPGPYHPLDLFLIFLKIGGLLYGSGYVLIAFMQGDLVDSRHWLTQQQLLDAIAVGQFTPGPLSSSATFAGYVIDGWRGAALATAGIFLPSFLLVGITHPFIPRLRQSAWAAPFLDGVNAAALALMAVVTFQLGQESLDNAFAALLFLIGAYVLVRYSPNSAWLVLAGAAAGILHEFA